MPINVTMTLRQALRQLESEQGRIDRQIAAIRGALDGLAGPKSRGGHPRPSGSVRRRRRMSATTKRALSQRMKAYWAKRRAVGERRKAKGAKAK